MKSLFSYKYTLKRQNEFQSFLKINLYEILMIFYDWSKEDMLKTQYNVTWA